MTGNSPRIWAAADLDPISPAPVHPPSPIFVPTLQSHADTHFTMPVTNGDLPALAVASATATAPATVKTDVDKRAYLPPAAVHNDAMNAVADAGSFIPGYTKSDMAVNGVAEKTEAALVGAIVQAIQEPETPQPVATGADQYVSKPNNTSNSEASVLTSDQVAVAASVHGISPSMSQMSPDAASTSSNLISQLLYKSPEHDQTIPDTAVSGAAGNTQPSQSSSELPAGAYSHHFSASNPIGHLTTNLQELLKNITARTANADAIHVPDSQGNLGLILQSAAMLPKLDASEPTSIQTYLPSNGSSCVPGTSQSNSMPLPLSNEQTTGFYAGAALAAADPYANTTITTAALSSIPHEASSIPKPDPDRGASPVNQSPPPNNEKQRWDTFLQEERKYVSEAKWDRFPEGSRIFIGNLSSERVCKKDVFNIFSKFGRLAQISLKQAYGFIQYHTVAEGQAAMDSLQGMDIKGKKINLEVSRAQKKESEGNRGNRGRRDSDRQDSNRRRDDYRPSRQSSPRRPNRRQSPHDGSNRGRTYHESSYSSDRRRSQSPGYSSRDTYRHRSPSPHHRDLPSTRFDIPYRRGMEVPDVQFLLLEDVKRDFVSWVQSAFTAQGLRVDVMFLHPQFPRESVIERQVLEGVHAVADLDFQAQKYGKIRLQIFDRSKGYNNIRYDQYHDLEPSVAAQLVNRTKSQSQVPPPSYHSNQYPPVQQYPVSAQGQYIPPSYPSQPYVASAPSGARNPPLDSTTVQNILGTLNGQQGGLQPYNARSSVDINALLATLSSTPQGMGGPAQNGMTYAQPPPNMPQGAPQGSLQAAPQAAPQANNSARHVEDIMTQLARYRQ